MCMFLPLSVALSLSLSFSVLSLKFTNNLCTFKYLKLSLVSQEKKNIKMMILKE